MDEELFGAVLGLIFFFCFSAKLINEKSRLSDEIRELKAKLAELEE